MRGLSATACIAATCIFALATSAQADDTIAYCKSIGETARVIMKKRQADFPMSALMQALDGIKGQTGEEGKFAREMVILAYQKPDFSTEENQKEAIAEFGNEAELACYQNFGR